VETPAAEEPLGPRPAPEPADHEPADVIADVAEEPAAVNDTDDELAARLVALQMAVAGADRREVAMHLEADFELVNRTAILDDVFGRGSGEDTRVSWPDVASDSSS
jgi:hypothetical protein